MRESSGLHSLISASARSDSLILNWEDNSGCASRLTSVNLRLWSDGVVPVSKEDGLKPLNSLQIPRSCLRLTNNGQNLFSITLSANQSCPIQWKPLDNCRKYKLEMESQYSSTWNGPTFTQEVFTLLTQHG